MVNQQGVLSKYLVLPQSLRGCICSTNLPPSILCAYGTRRCQVNDLPHTLMSYHVVRFEVAVDHTFGSVRWGRISVINLGLKLD